jgi:hypothetical protein
MMKKLLTVVLLIALVATPVASFAKKKSEIPQTTVEGLVLVPDTKDIAFVWAEPGADLSQYDRIHLVEPEVAFKKNWQKNQNRGSASRLNKVTSSDMERIKKDVAALFMEVFTEELTAGGYTLTEERAEDVLLVTPAIIDLYVSAPDIQSSARNNSYTTSAGSMTLYMKLYDSETDDLLAKALDPTSDRDTGIMQWSTSVSNRAAARRMMKPWAEALRGGLDESRRVTSQDQE